MAARTPDLDILRHDATWKRLSIGSQWLYGVIAADSFTDAAGISPLAFNRWAHYSSHGDPHDTLVFLNELRDNGRAVIDEDLGWVLLPRVLADTGRIKQPDIVRAAIKAARRCDSVPIRSAFANFLAQIEGDHAGAVIQDGQIRSSRRPIPPETRRSVYERDLWTCQGCQVRISADTPEQQRGLQAPFDGTGWLELDHIIPWSENGPDTVENLRALCTPCNKAKGARRLLGLDELVVAP